MVGGVWKVCAGHCDEHCAGPYGCMDATWCRIHFQIHQENWLTWLDAQESHCNAQLALTANRFNQLSNQLQLYKALGGDTQLPTPQVPTVQELIESTNSY